LPQTPPEEYTAFPHSRWQLLARGTALWWEWREGRKGPTPIQKLKAKARDSYIACLTAKPDQQCFTIIRSGS